MAVTLISMALAAALLLRTEPALAKYFVSAWLFNAIAATLARPATLNSMDASQALKSSRALLMLSLIETFVIHGDVPYGWVLIATFAATKLTTDGIVVHLLTPYSHGPLVLEQGDTTPPRWVTFHPTAWIGAVLINTFGVCAHLEAATRRLPMLLEAPFAVSLAAVAAALLRARVKAASGAWARRDAAWYPQPAAQPTFALASPHDPTFSTYIVASDGTRLAADVWLPATPSSSPRHNAARPTVLHFTPYNRNWRVRAALALRLLSKYGVGAASRHFNTRSLRYLQAVVPQGFAFVSVDVRGTGASFGHRECDLLPREVDDLVDVARWVRAQPWCDGWLASGGISYDGMAAMLLAAELPKAEALDAIFPLFSPMAAYEDLCLPGGVPCHGFSDPYAEFRTAAEHDRAPSHTLIRSAAKRLLYSLIAGRGDALAPGLERACLGALVRGDGGGVAPVLSDGGGEAAHARAEEERDQAIAAHASNWDHSEAIRRQRYRDDVMAIVDGGRKVAVAELDPASEARVSALAASGTAVYAYAGWFDSGSMTSALRLLDEQTRANGAPRVRLTVGPWNHGLRASCDAHANAGGRTTPRFDMYSDIAAWLSSLRAATPGASDKVDERVHFYMMGAVDACRGWRASPTWPPPGVRESSLLLCTDGELLTAAVAPPRTHTFSVDASATTVRASRWNLVQHILMEAVDYGDRRLAAGTVSFTSAPLEAPLAIAGTPRVRVSLALEGGTDAAVFAYLEDVPPAASAAVAYVTEGQVRAGFAPALNARTCAFTSACVAPFERGTVPVAMQPVAYTFGKGHRVRLSLAGADAANFLPVEGSAPRWVIDVNGASELVLPEWSE